MTEMWLIAVPRATLTNLSSYQKIQTVYITTSKLRRELLCSLGEAICQTDSRNHTAFISKP